MKPTLANLHNHTPFSDGAYSIDEICDAHLSLPDVTVIAVGICDHLFCTPASRPVGGEKEFERLFAAETRRYASTVAEAKRRWEGRLQVLCGAEVYWPLNRQHLNSVRALLSGFDYVLFECLDWAGLTTLANQSRRWPCPVGLAHTDVEAQFKNTSMDQVVRTISNARIFYEVSAKLMPLAQQQPWYQTLTRHRVNLTLGTDSHDELARLRDLRHLHDFLARHDLTSRLFLPQPHPREPAAQSA